MWFGDLVTMRWWDDLWLNESFAEWASHHAMVRPPRYAEGWTGFTNNRKNWAYRQDQLTTTHPVAADNHDLDEVEANFDGITYAKGAAALKQLVAWVGETSSWPGCAPTSPGTRSATRSSPTCSPRSRRPPAASWGRAPRNGCRPAGQHVGGRLRARPRRPLLRVPGAAVRAPRLPGAAAPPHRHRALRPRRRRPAGPPHRFRDRRDRRVQRRRRARRCRAARPAAAQRRRPDLREDPVRRAVAGDRAGVAAVDRGLAAAGAVLGGAVGHDPRRRAAAP